MNLACSGAKTTTFSVGGNFKPGLDFYSSGGNEGQALMLQHFAATHNVKLVAVSIGGNNFNFAGIVQTASRTSCSPRRGGRTTARTTAPSRASSPRERRDRQRATIGGAILNVAQAMSNAGYSSSQYTIVVQDYPSPIPNGSGFRYSQSGYTRQWTGGCGFWNNDANYANSTMLPTSTARCSGRRRASGLTNVKTLDLGSAFNGRRLCENSVGLLEEEGLSCWTATGAVDKSEWINQVRTVDRAVRPVRAPGRHPPELLGAAGAAQLPDAGLQRRLAAGRRVHDLGKRAERSRRAEHVAALIDRRR